jgi:hypothetical protein
MTDTLLPEVAAVEPPRGRSIAAGWRGGLTLWLTGTVGALLIATSYTIAARGDTGQLHFVVFWVGMLTLFVPTVLVTTGREVGDRVRLLWLFAFGLFTYLPKLLRDTTAPVFHDEIAHLRQTTDIAASGHFFDPNYIIPIAARYPGLHAVTAQLSEATGLSPWHTGLLLMAVAHVVALLAAALLGEALLGSLRAGAVVALVYALNSSFLYFDTQFAYESLAMPMFLLCLAFLAKAHRAAGATFDWLGESGGRPVEDLRAGQGAAAGWTAAAVGMGLATVAVHHLTAVILIGLLDFIAAGAAVAAARGHVSWASARASLVTAALVTIGAVLWFVLIAPSTFAYLSPYLQGGLDQLLGNLFGDHAGGRTLFQASTQPLWERVAAFTVPVVAGLLWLAAARQWRRQPVVARWRQPMRRALGLFGLLYFASIPFIMVSFGAEGARRTWGFSYIGLAVALAPLLLVACDRLAAQRGRVRLAAGAAALLLAGTALVGNVAAGLNEAYRFPGPFQFGSDARSFSPELNALSAWFARNLGPEVMVVTDRYTGLGLVRDADAHPAAPSPQFATYELFFNPGPPSDFLLHELSSSQYTYLVVDKRSAAQWPQLGVFFEPDEPATGISGNPITQANLARYQNAPWTTAVYESDSYVIYRFDFSAYGKSFPGSSR